MIRAAIIGCGQIGARYDTPGSDAILTHAHAIVSHHACELVALCDANIEMARSAAAIWNPNAHWYGDVNEMFANETIDLLCIASPTALHTEHLLTALQRNVSYIVCEKPLATTTEAIEQIEHALAVSQSRVIINFIRAFDPSTQQLATILHQGELGKVMGFQAQCNKGFLHNGSHMLALIEQLIAPIEQCSVVSAYEEASQWYGHFHLQCTDAEGIFSAYEHGASHFELTIMCEKARVLYRQGGSAITIEAVEQSQAFAGVLLYNEQRTLPNTMQRYQAHALHALLAGNSKELEAQLAAHLRLSKKMVTFIHQFRQKGYSCNA